MGRSVYSPNVDILDDTVKPRRCAVCKALVGYVVENEHGSREWKPLDNYAGFSASGTGYRCEKHPVLDTVVKDDYDPCVYCASMRHPSGACQ